MADPPQGGSSPSKVLSDDPDIAALETQAEVARLRKAIATDSLGTLAAQLPASETKGKEGKVEFKDQGGYYAEVLAYEALQEAARKVAGKLGKAQRKIILTRHFDLGARAQLWQLVDLRLGEFDAWFDQLLAAYRKKPKKVTKAMVAAVSAAVGALPGILGAAAEIAAFFRSNTQVLGRTVALADEALLSDVAQELERVGWQVLLPAVDITTRGRLVDKIQGLQAKKARARKRHFERQDDIEPELARLEQLRLDKRQAEERLAELAQATSPDQAAITREKQRIAQLERDILPLARVEGRWQATTAQLESVSTAFDALVTAVTQGTSDSPSPLEAVDLIDRIHSLEVNDLLMVKVVSQGGELQVSKDSFMTRLTYLGGAAIAFLHTDTAGQVIDAGTLPARKARSGRPRDFPTMR